ncbi:uncharacterized protein LOC128214980 [Mya arenaria]|uniref:uncharacterized protein LOC128214980 n=1 Tax=Mya arenaria TaxID=6604 RepID=UPI0022E2F8FA|nr:uncharacterized protein LOC128214980 [Mya arenaria]
MSTNRFCMCNSGFGLYRVVIRRSIYNYLKNKTVIREFEHPKKFLVLPKTETSYLRVMDDKYLYEQLEEMAKNGTDMDIIQNNMDMYINIINANESKVLLIGNVITFITFLCYMFISTTVFSFPIWLYFKTFVRIPGYVRRYMQSSIDTQQDFLALAQEVPDIFISHAEEQYTFVVNELLTFLENDCSIKVLLPERDFHPGQNIFLLYSKFIHFIPSLHGRQFLQKSTTGATNFAKVVP